MTNLKKFAAQQLTKKQMNEVKGGYYACFCDQKAAFQILQLDDPYWAIAWLDVNCGSGGGKCNHF